MDNEIIKITIYSSKNDIIIFIFTYSSEIIVFMNIKLLKFSWHLIYVFNANQALRTNNIFRRKLNINLKHLFSMIYHHF
jgi:hypothetical protein